MEQVFTNIYNSNIWGNNNNPEYNGSSGGGSDINYNKECYIPFLKEFISHNNIKSVVDLGCGDFRCGKLIYDNLDILYTGYDTYKKLIEYNSKHHSLEKYSFHHLDFCNNKERIIDGDLCILKDVLQHWSLEDIYRCLDYLIENKKFKYILICNCSNQRVDNLDIQTGSVRDLSCDYYPLKKYNPVKLLKYHTKEVSLITINKQEPLAILSTSSVQVKIDAVIPTCIKDLDILDLCIKGLQNNIENLRNIYVICDSSLKDKINGGIFVDEKSFPFNISDVTAIIFGDPAYKGTGGRSGGWYLQQLLKLYSMFVIEGIASNVLIVDSDTLFFNKYSPIINNIGYYTVSSEVNLDYRKHMNIMLNDIVSDKRYSGICHQMLIQKHILQDLFDRVEKKYNKPFWKVMLDISKDNNGLYYSEYDLYFNFAFTFYNENVQITDKITWDISPDIPNMSDYTYITAHKHIRGHHDVPCNFYKVDINKILSK
jgi:hypothetical protein